MKAERTCGGSVIEPRGHSLTLHQHSALLKLHCCCEGVFHERGQRPSVFSSIMLLTEGDGGREVNVAQTLVTVKHMFHLCLP